MSAKNGTFGIQHLTVVPTNFESAAATPPTPDDDHDEADDEEQ